MPRPQSAKENTHIAAASLAAHPTMYTGDMQKNRIIGAA